MSIKIIEEYKRGDGGMQRSSIRAAEEEKVRENKQYKMKNSNADSWRRSRVGEKTIKLLDIVKQK